MRSDIYMYILRYERGTTIAALWMARRSTGYLQPDALLCVRGAEGATASRVLTTKLVYELERFSFSSYHSFSLSFAGRRKPRKGRFQTSEALGFVGSAASSSSCASSLSRDGSTGSGGKGQEGPLVQVMDIPSSFRSLLKNVTKDVVSSLIADRYTLLFDVYASPALQSLLFVLNHIGLESKQKRDSIHACLKACLLFSSTSGFLSVDLQVYVSLSICIYGHLSASVVQIALCL